MTQADRILGLLEEAGPKGVSNYTLNSVAYRYAARLHELKKRGVEVETEHIKGSEWRFKLKEDRWQEPEKEGSKLRQQLRGSLASTSTPTTAVREEVVKNTRQTNDRSLRTQSWLEQPVAKGGRSRGIAKPKESTKLACNNCGLWVRECKCSIWEKR